jgi:hypothetical protein
MQLALRGLVASVLILLGSCGDGNEQSGDEAATTPTDNPAPIVIEATEYGYDLPEEIPAGTITFRFTNAGEQPHEYGLVRLDEDQSGDGIKELLVSGEDFPKGTTDEAGVPVLSPGLSVGMTREFEAGTYAFYCYLPTPQGAPHVTEGMVATFEATTPPNDSPPPQPELVITVDDKGFDVPPIEAGSRLVQFRNEGDKKHEFALISFESGKGERDLGKWFESGYQGDPPALFPGGIQAIPPMTSVVMKIDFESGRTYTLEDFPNKMSTEITID